MPTLNRSATDPAFEDAAAARLAEAAAAEAAEAAARADEPLTAAPPEYYDAKAAEEAANIAAGDAAARLAEAAAAEAAEAAARAEAAAARLAEAAAAEAAEAAARVDEPLTAAPPEYYDAKAAEEAANIAAGDAAAPDSAAGDSSHASEPVPGNEDAGNEEPFSPPQAWAEAAKDRKDRPADAERGDAKGAEHGRNGEEKGGPSDGENGAELAAAGSGMSEQADEMGSLASDGGMVSYGHGQANEHRPEHAQDHREDDQDDLSE